ncbi:hypothetical protein EUGRSUZ_H01915 [Eucalyptus grandis]|uniref:Uncharacterized protein n=2 Tax=Eucalyptus grandis TaxID=71139 RepID=A0ACC3JQV2_EUCGR|nr:hypothetical protein EUGRSUZ_H01915 [Eucalyptus grandis]
MNELSKPFNLVYNQQKKLCKELQAFAKKLDKQLKSTKVWKRVTKAIFLTAFVATLIFSVVAVTINAPPFVTALAAGLAAPIGTVGKSCDTRWKNCHAKLEKKKELIDMMNMRTLISIVELKRIWSLLNQLKTNANFTLGEEQEEAVKPVMLEIQKKLEEFMATIENLSTEANESRRHIELAMNMISQRVGDVIHRS